MQYAHGHTANATPTPSATPRYAMVALDIHHSCPRIPRVIPRHSASADRHLTVRRALRAWSLELNRPHPAAKAELSRACLVEAQRAGRSPPGGSPSPWRSVAQREVDDVGGLGLADRVPGPQQLRIGAVCRQELVVRSQLDDAAVGHDDDAVGGAGLAHLVRGEDDRPAPTRPPDGRLHPPLRLWVERRGGLVQQQQRRVADQRARQSDALPLTARERGARRTDERAVTVGQASRAAAYDTEWGGAGRNGSDTQGRVCCHMAGHARLDLGGRSLFEAVRDVLGDGGVGEERRLLWHPRDAPAQFLLGDGLNLPAIQAEAAPARAVEAEGQGEDSRLARARPADDGHPLARPDRQVERVEHRHHRPGRVAEGDAVQVQGAPPRL
eukprot:scaffold1309_cov117-Isochrysis_galbana.AAC.24